MRSGAGAVLVVAAVALVVAAAWGPMLRAPFLFDDHIVVEKAAAGADGILSGLAREPRPLRALSHRIDARIFGPKDAAGPHAVNLALHAVCAALWFALLLRLGRPRVEAAVAALLFAAMPVCGDALGIVSHRKEMLALAPMLGALLLAVPAPGGSCVRSAVRIAAAAVLFAIAALGKETALVLPALAALCAWESSRRGAGDARASRPRLAPVAALAAAGLLFAAFAWLQVRASMAALPGASDPVVGPRPGHLPPGTPVGDAAAWALWALPRYAARLFAPWGHCLDPATPAEGPGSGAIAAGLSVLAVWATAFLFAARRRNAFALPLGWMAFALAPALVPSLLATGGLAVLADRYAYAAALGAALLAAAVLHRLPPRAFAAASSASILAAIACSHDAAGAFASEKTLWEAVLRRNPESYLAHYNLAYEAWKRGGDAASARGHFARMSDLRPDFAQGSQAYVNFLSEKDGSFAALRWLDARIGSGGPPSLRKIRGALRSTGGDLAGAEEDLRACLAAGIDDSAVRHNLAVVLQRELKWKEAAKWFDSTKDDPRLPDDAALAAALAGAWPRRPVPTECPARIVIAGDSVSGGYDTLDPGRSRSLAERLNLRARRSGDRSIAFSNRAVAGSLLHNLPETLPASLENPSVLACLVLSGHNDAFAGAPPALLLRDIADCILLCRLRGVEPIVLGPIPVRSVPGRDRTAQEETLAAWNGMLGSFCAGNGVRYLDIRASIGPALLDPATGNHLSNAGMERLADLVEGTVRNDPGFVPGVGPRAE